MSWPFETSTAHVTPEDYLAYRCRRDGVTREQLTLPPVMVATFQRASYARLVEQTGATVPPTLQPASYPGGTGAAGMESIWAGKLPGTGRPVAVVRLPVGAPAT